MKRAGVPGSVAMKLSGHKTESIYTRYAIVASRDLEEGVQKLETLQASDIAPRTVVSITERMANSR
jgi:hypothetical protein